MDAKEAIKAAKDGITNVFSDEDIRNLGLEEINPDGQGGWIITLGFSRPWDSKRNVLNVLGGTDVAFERQYKVVYLNAEGVVQSIKNRDY